MPLTPSEHETIHTAIRQAFGISRGDIRVDISFPIGSQNKRITIETAQNVVNQYILTPGDMCSVIASLYQSVSFVAQALNVASMEPQFIFDVFGNIRTEVRNNLRWWAHNEPIHPGPPAVQTASIPAWALPQSRAQSLAEYAAEKTTPETHYQAIAALVGHAADCRRNGNNSAAQAIDQLVRELCPDADLLEQIARTAS